MAKYKVLKNVDFAGVKLIKDTIIEGEPIVNNQVKVQGKTFFLKHDLERVAENTPLSVITQEQVEIVKSDSKGLQIASGIGSLAGVGYAFYKKKSVMGYIGFMMLGGIVGSLVWHIVKPKEKFASARGVRRIAPNKYHQEFKTEWDRVVAKRNLNKETYDRVYSQFISLPTTNHKKAGIEMFRYVANGVKSRVYKNDLINKYGKEIVYYVDNALR